MKFKFMTTVFILILFVIQPFNSSSKYDYYPTDGWLSATPEEHGMSSAVLVGMYEYIEKNNLDIDCVIVIKNGYIVEERYLDPKYDQNTLHQIYSCTKSITSALIGITIHDGYISSINRHILDFFPEREIANLDSQKQAITLEHLLSMTSGLDWKEWPTFVPYGDPANTVNKWHESEDWVKFVLDRPMANESGEVFNYNSGTSHLLSAIIQYVTGNSTLSFAQKHLFGPLGIKSTNFDWPTDPQGINLGGTGITMTPRDMAKFGFLYLNYGIWDGKQIIPREWVEISTRSHISASSHIRGKDYGYQWW
ncbi:MAG: serine hydrolase domain-containing protein, partial [Candidatus Hodarchaeota archaeon]